MIYQDSLDVQVSILHSDDQGVIIMREDSVASFLEKVMLIPDSSCSLLGNPRDMMFTVNTSMMHFLQDELELSPLVKPSTMVLTMKSGAL